MITKPTIQSGQSTAPQITPEWIRIPEACQFAHVSKTVMYDWIKRGFIKNYSNRRRGQVKGARLIFFDSLRSFLTSHASGGSNNAS